MNNRVIYNGNHNDLFLPELMDKVQVKSILTGELVTMEWLGDHEGATDNERYDFGSASDCSIDIELYKDKIKLFSGAGLDVTFDRHIKRMEFHVSERYCRKGMIAQNIFPEIHLPRPKTMRAFTISIKAFIAHIYSTSTQALEIGYLEDYEKNNHWPYCTIKDADLPF